MSFCISVAKHQELFLDRASHTGSEGQHMDTAHLRYLAGDQPLGLQHARQQLGCFFPTT